MAATKTGNGYWLVGANGAVYARGDAANYGTLAGHHLNAPITGIVITPSGHGFWLVALDGGVFAFADARYYGSLGGTKTGTWFFAMTQ